MKTKLALLLIFFSFVGILVFQACSAGGGSGGGGGGGGSPADGSTATITVLQPPIIVAKNTDGTSGEVSVGAAISVIFSTAIDPLTVTTSSFTVGGVGGTVAYNSGTKTATFTPSSPLANSTTYTATLTTGIKDSAGNAMASAFTWSFRTASPPINSSVLLGGAVQGNSLQPDVTVVSTIAGTSLSFGSTDGTGTAAQFKQPYGITTDGTNLFVTDSQNHTIRKIVISTGVVTTIAGTVGSSGFGDGTGSAARFNQPFGVTTDGVNLYVADSYNYTIRKIVISTGVVTTLAGTAGATGTADGTGAAARFGIIYGITNDGTNLYVADGNFTFRKIVISTGDVTTLAGGAGIIGGVDGAGTAARFGTPAGITTDGKNLYVGDSNATIRKIVISTGVVTTIAGIVSGFGSTDGIGSAARFSFPTGITTDGTNLFVVDTGRVRKIVLSTLVVTTPAIFTTPTGITTDGINLFATALNDHTVKKISSVTATVPSTPPASLGAAASDGQVVFSWSSVTGATSYNLYCAAGTSVTTTTGTKIAKIASPYYLGSYWTATPVVIINDTNYSCIVTAENNAGETLASSPTTVTPVATYLLSVSKVGTTNGSGTVTSSPSGISCGSTCTATVTNGATIILTATPASGSTFTGWSGACSGTGACTPTMSSDQTAIANFLGTATPPPSGGTYYWSNWSCSSSQCQTTMGGASGSVGNFCTLSDCNACNAIACIGIFGGTCSLTATSTQRVVTPSNGVCLRSGVDF